MNPDVYQQMAQVEDTHWWFRARRTITRSLLKGLDLPANAAILDAGSGTGGNLAMLAEFGRVFAMELDAGARILANKRGIVNVEEGMLPDKIPFAEQQFDLAVMFDVLEHIDRDFDSLTALKARLAPGGKILITVPAFPFLWSAHDVAHQHKRRYTLAPLTALFERAGYTVTFASYINFWLFPLIAAVRLFGNLTGTKPTASELSIPPAPLNRLLEAIFASETCLIRIMRLPFGVSIVLSAQKI